MKKPTKKMIDEVARLNARFNETKKELEAKKGEIKTYCREANITSLEGSSFCVNLSERTSYSFNQEKAVEIAKKAKAKWLLKEVVDESILEDAIRTGEIDASLFKDCYETKTSSVISFKALK